MRFRYILFNKPFGVVSQFSGEGSTLKDYIRVKDIYPVGRLDHDSEGLLLLTDDGELQHRLSDPKFVHPRTYWAQVERIPGEQALQQLAVGVTIQGYRTRPTQVRLLPRESDLPPRHPPIRFRKNVPTAWMELILTEGRNRQGAQNDCRCGPSYTSPRACSYRRFTSGRARAGTVEGAEC